MDGQIDGEGWLEGWTDRWRRLVGGMDRQMEKVGWTDGWMDGEGWLDGRTDGEGQMDGWRRPEPGQPARGHQATRRPRVALTLCPSPRRWTAPPSRCPSASRTGPSASPLPPPPPSSSSRPPVSASPPAPGAPWPSPSPPVTATSPAASAATSTAGRPTTTSTWLPPSPRVTGRAPGQRVHLASRRPRGPSSTASSAVSSERPEVPSGVVTRWWTPGSSTTSACGSSARNQGSRRSLARWWAPTRQRVGRPGRWWHLGAGPSSAVSWGPWGRGDTELWGFYMAGQDVHPSCSPDLCPSMISLCVLHGSMVVSVGLSLMFSSSLSFHNIPMRPP